MVDAELAKVAKEIEKFIWTSQLRKSYKAVPPSRYNTSIYSIYHYGNDMIPLVQEWVDRKISNRSELFDLAFQQHTSEAICVLEKYLNESMIIKYASLNFGKQAISLTLDVEEESWKSIQNTRKTLAKVYENLSLCISPINEKLQIMLAYGNRKRLTVNELNKLNYLVRPFNGAKLMLPSIYLHINKQYILVQKKPFIDCRVY